MKKNISLLHSIQPIRMVRGVGNGKIEAKIIENRNLPIPAKEIPNISKIFCCSFAISNDPFT